MSEATTVQQTSNQMLTNYDVSKIFLNDCLYITKSYTNATGDSVTLTPGRVMGLIFGTDKVVPQDSTLTNGAQVPYGILKTGKTVANGATVEVVICVKGTVAQGKILFATSQTMATSISLTDSATNTVVIGTIESLLLKAGLFFQPSDEMTAVDNQPV